MPVWERLSRAGAQALRVDPEFLALLDLGPGGAADPLSLSDPILFAAARRFGQDASGLSAPALRLCTRSSDAGLRAQAALALGFARDPGGEPFLAALVRDVEPTVRVRAVQALGLIGDPAALAVLEASLSDRQEEVRVAAAHALGELRDPAASEALWQVTASGDSVLRRAAFESIAEIGGATSSPVLRRALADPAFVGGGASNVDALYDLARAAGRASDAATLAQWSRDVSDPDPVLRRATVVALGASRDPLAVPALVRALADPDGQVRGLAADALGEVGDPSAAGPLLKALAGKQALLAGQDRAAPALVAIGAFAMRDRLRQLAASPDPAVASAALAALGKLGTAADVPIAVQDLAASDSLERAAAAGALADLAVSPSARAAETSCGAWGRVGVLTDADLAARTSRARPPIDCALRGLLKAARDRDPLVRAAVAEALGALADGRASGELFALSRDADPSVAQAARVALGRSGVPWADRSLEHDVEAGSTGAALGLAELGGATSASHIAMLLESQDPGKRGPAATALSRLVGRGPVSPAAIAALLRSIRDPDRDVRIQAAVSLSAVPGAEVGLALQRAALMANPEVRPWFAASAIRQATLAGSRTGARGDLVRRDAGRPGLARDWALLADGAGDADPEFRLAALSALGWLARPRGLQLAVPALVSRWPAVRDAAVDVLVRTPASASGRLLDAIVERGHWSEAVRALDEVSGRDPRVPGLLGSALAARDIRTRWAGERLAARARR